MCSNLLQSRQELIGYPLLEAMSAAAVSTFSAKTLRHYQFCIGIWKKRIGDVGELTTVCLEQPASVLSVLDQMEYQLSSKISMISALLWHLRTTGGKAVDEFRLYPYIKRRDYLQNALALEVHDREGGLSKKEESNYLSWKEILDVYVKMTDRITARGGVSGVGIGELQDFVIVALYVLQPPIRADYGNMRVFLEAGDVPGDFRDNYFVLYPDAKFVLWRYKNAGRGGLAKVAQEHQVEGELLDVLTDWLGRNACEWLLISRKGGCWGAMSENALSSRVRSIFHRWTGRTASINTLRHAYVTFVREEGAAADEKRDVARKMMHHPLTSETYVRVV